MEESKIQNIPSLEEELAILRSKISETFGVEGLTSKVYESIENWKSKRRIEADSYREPKEAIRERFLYNIELAEICAEIGDGTNLEDCIKDLIDIWENTKENLSKEEYASFRDRLNQLIE